ncbi:lipopolysaccharide biosynthesis protein [Microbacterium sp. NPDC056736]|uniref:lipopolysaccharide biosynthesis protein n=1 Tax=Microbacterium sp. NPDC056736 TaxID=3345932 RepID=UPI003672CAE7
MVGRQFLIRLVGLGAASLIQALWLILLARQTGVDAVGVYTIVTAWFLFASSVLGLGMGAYALRLGPQSLSSDRAVTTMALLRFGTVIVIALGCVTASNLLEVSPHEVALIAIMYGALESITELSQGVLSGRRRVVLAVSLLLVQRALPLTGLLLYMLTDASTWVFLGLALAIVVSSASLLTVATRPIPVAQVLRPARGFWATTVVSNVSQLDTPLVGLTAGVSTASLFGTANRLTNPLNLVTSALLNVLVPELVATTKHESRMVLFRRVRNIALILGAILVALAYPLGMLAVTLLGPEFEAIIPFVIGFVVAAALSGVSRTYQAGLFALDHARQVAAGILAGALTGLGLIVALGTLGNPAAVALAPPIAQVVVLLWLAVAWRSALRDAHTDEN